MSEQLEPGNTPLEEVPGLAAWASLERLQLKREDLNPNGSHKDRGALEQISSMTKSGQRVGVISSSGNAALSAAAYGAPAGITIVALVSPRTDPGRLEQLVDRGARVVVTERPINYSLRLARVTAWPDLRPSRSDAALLGFRTLGRELAELEPGTPIVAYASSGTTFQAIGEELGGGFPLHPVQAGVVNGITGEFGRPGDGRLSQVGDLGVKHSERTGAVVELVRASGGQAWWVPDSEISEAGQALAAAGLEVAKECWAALAGARAMAEAGAGRSACLILTGRQAPDAGSREYPVADSFKEVLARVEDLR